MGNHNLLGWTYESDNKVEERMNKSYSNFQCWLHKRNNMSTISHIKILNKKFKLDILYPEKEL